jgi:hypothetical protein
MQRAHRILVSALLISLAIHLLLLASAGFWWTAPAQEIPFPIEASLVLPEPEPPAAPAPVARPKPKPKPKPTQAAPVAHAAVETPAPPPPAEPPPEEVAAPATTPGVAAPVAETPAAPAAAQPVPAPPPEPARRFTQRKFPEHLNLRYAVRAGEGGFNLGQASYTWQQRDGHYSLVSIAQASGLAALFVSGKLVQTSEGSITQSGLRPEQYWLSRNQRKQDMAHFDWGQGRLVQGGSGVELPAGSQDLLSFPFHLAMTVDESVREWSLWVTNGRKLREYLFRNLGHERLTLGEGEVDTLHLQGGRSGEGTLDVWLAPSRHWLPLRIRTLDQKGKVLMLSLEEIT